jgi:hypothetical protein
MLRRFELLKRIAEGPDWERYLEDAEGKPFATESTGSIQAV